MKRTSDAAALVSTSYDYRDEYPRAANEKTFADLLVNHTVDQILNLPQSAPIYSLVAAFFLLVLSDHPDTGPELNNLILSLDEPKLNLTMLKRNCCDLYIGCPLIAKNILNALKLEPNSSFSNLSISIHLLTSLTAQSILPVVVELLQLNNGIHRVEIYFYHEQNYALNQLVLALAKIENLYLGTSAPLVLGSNRKIVMEQSHINGLLDLISMNKTIQRLSLKNFVNTKDIRGMHDNHLRLFKLLKNLPRLSSLTLADITEDCQALLGEFLRNSSSIKMLHIGLEAAVFTPCLIQGLEGNSSLQDMEIHVAAVTRNILVEDSILPLFSLIEKNKTFIRNLDLKMHRCDPEIISEQINTRREDCNNETALSALIANNSCLRSLSIMFPDIDFDPLPIGEALEKNACLEELNIRFFNSAPNSIRALVSVEPAGRTEFLTRFSNNRTLTKFSFEYHDQPRENIFFNSEQTNEITLRNSFFQKYWCSEAYFYGAASAFLGSLGMPADPAFFIAKHLMSQKPVIAARALAIVNKATSSRALEMRRDQNRLDWRQAIVANGKDRDAALDDAARLLGNIATTKQDFSDEELRLIAGSEHFDRALFLWMESNVSFYIYLVSRFSGVVGVNELKRRLIDQFLVSTNAGLNRFVSMLEQTFLPDQQHLLRIIKNELDYRSIDCASARAFVGYGITHGYASQEVVDWCLDNQQPELYFAYASKFPFAVVELMEMSPDFREVFIAKMLEFKTIRKLQIEDDRQESFLLVKDVLLVEETGLEELFLTNAHLLSGDFTLLMDKLGKNRELKVFEIALLKEDVEFPLAEKIRETLEANPFLESFSLALPADHFEFQVLGDLALAEPRLSLENLNDEDSD